MASSARIDELRKKFEENPRRYFAPLANEYRKAGQIDQAIAICREYLPQQPGHMSGHIVYGQALYEARQFEEAKGVFETALALDPENLIALRHLGDIALLIGDSEGARTWYRRVLEADPRNEEIQAQLLTLEQSAPTPDSEFAPPTHAETSTAPTVVVEAQTQDAERAAPQAQHPSGEVKRQPWARKTPTADAPGIVASGASSAPTPAIGVPVQPADAFRSSDHAQGGGAAGTSGGAAATPLQLESPVAGISIAPAQSPAVETSSVAGLETTSLTGSAPSVESPLASSSPAGAGPPQLSSREASLPRLSLVDVPVVNADQAAAGTSPESGPFVTETMAELYLKQGHTEEALRVYRALAEQRPSEAALQEKVSSLEAQLRAGAPGAENAATASGTTGSRATSGETRNERDVGVAGGPTIRELLDVVAQRRPGFRPTARGNGNAPAAAARGADVRSAPRDALASLLSSTTPPAGDEKAALVLALAFTEVQNGAAGGDSDPSGLTGAPAHRASNELTLETVFGAGGHVASGGPVSYDQFFAQRPSGSPPAGGDSADDVAQFTKWLEGLKRR